ncbi:hypothetical protein [Ramlibacter sp.]|uniref:hypothetical protein n=1 Tax=Ramlibacter sp. TaxID=1917967 RepID=UPI003D14C175
MKARSCRVALPCGEKEVFELHAHIARRARSALVEDAPALRAWGQWEFTLCDPQGNRLVFCEPARAAAPSPHEAGTQRRPASP